MHPVGLYFWLTTPRDAPQPNLIQLGPRFFWQWPQPGGMSSHLRAVSWSIYYSSTGPLRWSSSTKFLVEVVGVYLHLDDNTRSGCHPNTHTPLLLSQSSIRAPLSCVLFFYHLRNCWLCIFSSLIVWIIELFLYLMRYSVLTYVLLPALSPSVKYKWN